MKIKKPSISKINLISKEWYQNLYGVKFTDWNRELKNISFPFRLLDLNKEELDIILGEEEVCVYDFESLLIKIQKKMYKKGNFVKLITRSPKDFLIQKDNSIKNIYEPLKIIECLRNSMRTFEDICLLRNLKLDNVLIIRPYINIDPSTEFRCFIKNNELIGVSQYHYDFNYNFQKEVIDAMFREITKFVNEKITPNMIVSDFIADICFTSEIKLIETNPYGLSDPCLYKSYDFLESRQFKFLVNE